MTAQKKQTAANEAPAHPWFAPAALTFLRGLKRNNRREWFEARREVFELELKAPMLALIEQINASMESYAPDYIREARRTLLRIYRDTRFSADKTPYKQHIAAWWSPRGAEKTSDAGYYLHLGPTELTIAAGVYMPSKDQLLAIRRSLLDHHEEFASLLREPKLRRRFALHDPMPLTRAPKGFPAEHPAAEWIRWRQWGVVANLPPETALDPKLPRIVDQHFRLAAPLVDFLHRAIISGRPRPVSLVGRPLHRAVARRQ